jgi:hypothetical protein
MPSYKDDYTGHGSFSIEQKFNRQFATIDFQQARSSVMIAQLKMAKISVANLETKMLSLLLL